MRVLGSRRHYDNRGLDGRCLSKAQDGMVKVRGRLLNALQMEQHIAVQCRAEAGGRKACTKCSVYHGIERSGELLDWTFRRPSTCAPFPHLLPRSHEATTGLNCELQPEQDIINRERKLAR